MRFVVVGVLGVVLLAAAWGLVEGTSQADAGAAAPRCAQLGGWQRLADRINAGVLLPSWFQTLSCRRSATAGTTSTRSTRTASYLESWAWQEAAGLNTQEIHVILRGYPGPDGDPAHLPGREDGQREDVPQEDRRASPTRAARVRAPGIVATVYTVNQDADPGTSSTRGTAADPLHRQPARRQPLTYPQVIPEPGPHPPQPRARGRARLATGMRLTRQG